MSKFKQGDHVWYKGTKYRVLSADEYTFTNKDGSITRKTRAHLKYLTGDKHFWVNGIDCSPDAPASNDTPGVDIKFDTPEWRAWNIYWAQLGEADLPHGIRGYWRVPSQWPPGHPNGASESDTAPHGEAPDLG